VGKRAIVIGAGFGGMAAALRMRAKGYHVTLIDRCSQLGGRAQVFERDGFRHDAGPTVITAPFLIERLFDLFDERMQDHLTLVPVKPWYRFHFADGDTFDYGGTLEETLAEIARIEPGDRVGYEKLLKHSKRIFDVGFTKLSSVPFDRFSSMLKQVVPLIRLRSDRSVFSTVSRYLQSPKLRQAFSIQPLLVGGNPFNTTSIYSLIHYLERAYGVHFAMGGTGAITRALGALMERQGIEIRLGETIDKIRIENGTATGVVMSDGAEMAADIVVANADSTFLYSSMVPKAAQVKSTKLKLTAAKYSMGLFVLYFGTKKTYPDVAHHTIWLGSRYKELLEDIFDRKILAEDFSLYVHRPTATDKSFAPPDCDSFYVLCPVPNLQADIDWSVEGPRLKDRIVAALEQTILPGLRSVITADFFKSPVDFKSDYLSQHGAGFSLAPIFRQSAWFRFHNRAEGVKNLYLVGAGTHPGAGLPGVLCSAEVVDALVPQASLVRPELIFDYKTADLLLANKGKSFHWARRWLGATHATRATRLYRFCRQIDDLVDEAQAPAQAVIGLDSARVSILRGSSSDSNLKDFIELLKECRIDSAIPLDLISGVNSDLHEVRIQNEDELLRYCYQVAGTVGLMMASVLDVMDEAALPHAIDLGIAMQLTNICRDISEDARAGRRYLPASYVGDYDPAELISPTEALRPILRVCVARILDLADIYYKSAEDGMSYLPWRARWSIEIAAKVYRGIGVKLRRRNFDYWSSRTVVSGFQKLFISMGAFLGALVRPSFHKAASPHRSALHAALVFEEGDELSKKVSNAR